MSKENGGRTGLVGTGLVGTGLAGTGQLSGASQPASQPGLALVQRTSSKDYVKRERWENGTMSKENGGRTGLVQKENGESRTGTGTRTVN